MSLQETECANMNVSWKCIHEFSQAAESVYMHFAAVLNIRASLPVRRRQLWRRTENFLLIFLQPYVYDLRFKA